MVAKPSRRDIASRSARSLSFIFFLAEQDTPVPDADALAGAGLAEYDAPYHLEQGSRSPAVPAGFRGQQGVNPHPASSADRSGETPRRARSPARGASSRSTCR